MKIFHFIIVTIEMSFSLKFAAFNSRKTSLRVFFLLLLLFKYIQISSNYYASDFKTITLLGASEVC